MPAEHPGYGLGQNHVSAARAALAAGMKVFAVATLAAEEIRQLATLRFCSLSDVTRADVEQAILR